MYVRDLGSIGGPGEIAVLVAVLRKRLLSGAIGIHDINISIAVSIADERDLRFTGIPAGDADAN
jgi:hypothetical protein